jgi:hypothetical protein
MKRFIYSVFAVSVFCVGLGSLAEKAGARFKSDEKALAIIRDARQAIGGDTALIAVRGMVITGQTTRMIKIDGVDKTIQGDTQIAMQLPDKLMKMIDIRHGESQKGMVQRQVDVVVTDDKNDARAITPEPGQKIVIKKSDGTTQEINSGEGERVIIRKVDGDKGHTEIEHAVTTGDGNVMFKRVGGPEHEAMRQNEMLRLTLGLLLTAPQGMDVSYTYGGETDVDGIACNVVVAESGGSSFRLLIGKSSNLPVAMTYKGNVMPHVMMFKTKAPEGDQSKDNVVFTRKVDAPPMETADITVKFSDYRSVGGLQLPFHWEQTANAASDEVFDVTSYEINPANIPDRFNNDKLRVKIKDCEQN